MFLFRLFFSPVKILLFLARVVGYSRFGLFLIGILVGLAVAPTTGAEFRARIHDLIEGDRPGAAPTH